MIAGPDADSLSSFSANLSATRYAQQQAPEAVIRVAALVGYKAAVLEIGPATGILTRMLSAEQGCEVTAIEIDPMAAERARSLCKAIHIADIESIEISLLLGDQKFNVVTFGDVLEHLRSPVAALKKVKPYIADDGCVVISVPNIAHASIAYELANGRFDYRPTGLLDVTHIRFFTRKSLLQVIDDAGYVVVDFDRVIVNPEQTEFNTKAYSTAQQQLLHYFESSNSESSTYQFIVRVVPRKADKPYVSETVVANLVDKLKTLENQLAAERTRADRFESDLSWIEKRWHIRWVRRLKSLVSQH